MERSDLLIRRLPFAFVTVVIISSLADQKGNVMTLSNYAVVGMATLMVFGVALIGAALFRPSLATIQAPRAWKPYSIGFPVYALIFLSFDMEMIFMYPWAVVFVEQGVKGFMDMLVFICILSAGIAYAWGMGGFKWE